MLSHKHLDYGQTMYYANSDEANSRLTITRFHIKGFTQDKEGNEVILTVENGEYPMSRCYLTAIEAAEQFPAPKIETPVQPESAQAE
jgi:hypothetical protein